VPFVRPRALQIEEMPYIVQQYARGARNALAAKFDGVEVHGANGYLIYQFISSGTNHYGGRVHDRARLLMEVVEAVSGIWGPDRVGVRLSPLGNLNDISDAKPEATFGSIARALSEYRFAYLHIVNPAATAVENGEAPDTRAQRMLALIREKYRGTPDRSWPVRSGHRGGMAPATQGGFDRLRPQISGQSGFVGPVLRAQAAQCR
jgi:N-ethylmaleimide reductase